MRRFGARAFIKTGAEGVYAAALLEQGLGIAVKCDDGAGRAAEVILAATLSKFVQFDELESFIRPTLRNWNGIAVGRLRPTEVFGRTAGD
jgi:L-asparaginase II